jgi:hypothetical protein
MAMRGSKRVPAGEHSTQHVAVPLSREMVASLEMRSHLSMYADAQNAVSRALGFVGEVCSSFVIAALMLFFRVKSSTAVRTWNVAMSCCIFRFM